MTDFQDTIGLHTPTVSYTTTHNGLPHGPLHDRLVLCSQELDPGRRRLNRVKELGVCVFDGCSKVTHFGKPFCVLHVGLNPLAGSVLQTLDIMEKETAAVMARGTKAIKKDSPILADLLHHM